MQGSVDIGVSQLRQVKDSDSEGNGDETDTDDHEKDVKKNESQHLQQPFDGDEGAVTSEKAATPKKTQVLDTLRSEHFPPGKKVDFGTDPPPSTSP